jgi:hypothetical protein
MILALAAMLPACRQQDFRNRQQGHLEVAWTGKDRGSLSGPATAQWCGLRRVLEVQSVRGDTGVAIALYPSQTIVPGTYRVMDPGKAESLPPSAGVAVRWLGPTIVQGFQGDSGRILVERSSSGLYSGRISARARSVVDTQHIDLSGTFENLVVTRDSLGCAAPGDSLHQDAESPDTGVH